MKFVFEIDYDADEGEDTYKTSALLALELSGWLGVKQVTYRLPPYEKALSQESRFYILQDDRDAELSVKITDEGVIADVEMDGEVVRPGERQRKN